MGNDDGRWRQEWSNTMVQCGMTAAGVRSGATQWSSAVWIQPWQGSMGRYGFNWPCQGRDSVGHWQRTREAACRRAGVSQGDESKILLAIGSKTLQSIHVQREAHCETLASGSKT